MSVDDFLPLKARDYHVLFALSRTPLHGYGLMKALEEQSDGLLQLDPTSLYRRLKALLRNGLVVETGPPSGEAVDDPRRQYYTLTDTGLAVLRAEARRMRGLVRGAEAARLIQEG